MPYCRGVHPNIVNIEKDGQAVIKRSLEPTREEMDEDKALLTVERIVAFADSVDLADVKPILERQITCNMDIAQEGLTNNYGARIGQVLLATRENDVITRAKAYAAAASDA